MPKDAKELLPTKADWKYIPKTADDYWDACTLCLFEKKQQPDTLPGSDSSLYTLHCFK